MGRPRLLLGTENEFGHGVRGSLSKKGTIETVHTNESVHSYQMKESGGWMVPIQGQPGFGMSTYAEIK